MKHNESFFKEIITRLDLMSKSIETLKKDKLEDFISQEKAKILFRRSTTWFWNLRKSGFPYTKLGGEVYYRRLDLLRFLQDNMKGDENESS